MDEIMRDDINETESTECVTPAADSEVSTESDSEVSTESDSEVSTESDSAVSAESDSAVSTESDSEVSTESDSEVSAEGDSEGAECEPEIVLECEELTKAYGSIVALGGISFKIPAGKVIGLLGPNGSGKTTFIKIVAGLLTKDSGSVRVCGNEIGAATKAMVSYLPERNSIPEYFTVGEAVAYYADFFTDFDMERAETMLTALRVPKELKIKSLSKGTKEKVQLILVMSRRARLYILDEPISGVDPAARDYIIDTILHNFAPNSSVVISTHLISDIEKAMDGFIFLKYGKVACIGTPSGLAKRHGKTVDEYFREMFRC